ncbi:MAG: DUF5808 domain-containing protein [Candidatus Limnocylindria bacterium]
MGDLAKLVRTLAWLAVFGAVYQELRRPPAERTWQGKVLGVVPYDFRIPTLERLRDAYWAPDTDRVFSDTAFGVGWAVNIPVAARKLNEGATQYLAASRSVKREIERHLPHGERGEPEQPQQPPI